MAVSNRGRFAVEGIGLTLVAVSLVFVGLEVRQNTAATRSATQQAVYEGDQQSNLNVMNNGRLRDLLVLTTDDPDWAATAPRDSDYLLLHRFYLNRFNNLENAYFHFLEGTLDPRMWAGQAGWIRLTAGQPLMRHFWADLEEAFMAEFREYMDSALAAASQGK